MSAVDVHRALWRHKVLIVLLTAAIVAAAWYRTSREQPTYKASTLVRVQQHVSNANDVFGALQTGGLLAQTYAEIVGTSKIADEISLELGGRVAADTVRGSLSGTQIQDLDLLSISATSHDPQTAADIANAAPGALTAFIASSGALTDQIVVVQPASVPLSPASPSMRLNLALALVLGLLLNGSLALLVDALRDRPTDVEEIEKITGRPVLAVIPELTLRPRAVPAPPGVDAKSDGKASDAKSDVTPLAFKRAVRG